MVVFMPHMLQRSDDLVLNDCDSPRRLHSRPMASLAPLSPRHPAGLIPSGELWLPRPSLKACLRAAIARSTVGHTHQRCTAHQPLSGIAAVQPELVV